MDDLIEKYSKISDCLKRFGSLIFSKIDNVGASPILSVCDLVRGKEIGSKNYISKSGTPYIRVSNLDSCEYDNFVADGIDVATCQTNDILLALDGAPGRVQYGLQGAYSSGIYKVRCSENVRGLIYFYLISDECQNLIKSSASGTTILHASKSIKEMKVPTCDLETQQQLNAIFLNLVFISQKISKLKDIKSRLLNKYFQ